MAKKISKKEKKRLFLISLILIILLFFLGVNVYVNFKKIKINKDLNTSLNEQYNNLLDEEEKLEAEITKLGDDEYLVRYAKEKYMLTSDGDTIIKMD